MKPPVSALPLFAILLSLLLMGAAVLAYQPGPASASVDLSAYPWLYLRQGKQLAKEEILFELIAVGDVMLGRGLAGEVDPLGKSAPWLRAADLTLGNLEGALAAPGLDQAPQPSAGEHPVGILTIPTASIPLLQAAGFDLLGLANNHSLDLGPESLASAVDQLAAAGLQPLGVAPPFPGGQRAVIRQSNGLRLAFLAFNAVPPPPGVEPERAIIYRDPETLAAIIEPLRNQVDGVVVFAHWGREYETHVDPFQQEIAQLLCAAGADLVVGHHPHVVQGTQVTPAREENPASGDQFVAFSLGNFVFDQFEGQTQQGLALRAFFDRDGLRAVQALPLLAGRQPRLMRPEEASALLARIAPPPQPLGFSWDGGEYRQIPAPSLAGTGLFWSGEIDLTGDHRPEKVSRQGEQVVIYERGDAVWQSPEEWQVMDLALGDPNDDGRGELMLVLYKPDRKGRLRSHPFIVGYRGGRYRTLWGGSATSDPILEVELGDLDGDGVQEMVILEAQGDPGRSAVSVWRWHGWGFSLLWRSQIDNFRDVTLEPLQGTRGGQILVNRTWHRGDWTDDPAWDGLK